MTTFADRMPPVRADAEQLLQVFLNLSLNAIQAVPPGGPGKLFISTALRRATRRGATAAFLEVRFRDTGVGIPAGDLKNLFIPFFTTKDKGTGLGLPISQRIIENHGGTIEVRSQPGEGATFTVLLPIEADAYAAYLDATRDGAAPDPGHAAAAPASAAAARQATAAVASDVATDPVRCPNAVSSPRRDRCRALSTSNGSSSPTTS